MLHVQLTHLNKSLVHLNMSKRWDSPVHSIVQKNNVVQKKLGLNLNPHESPGRSNWTPRSSSLDLQWSLRFNPPGKLLIAKTCSVGSNAPLCTNNTKSRNTERMGRGGIEDMMTMRRRDVVMIYIYKISTRTLVILLKMTQTLVILNSMSVLSRVK